MSVEVAALSTDERTALTDAETTIQRGIGTFVEVGEALTRVRDSRLYREDYDTFEDYCRQRWDLSRKRAYDLMGASDTVRAMSPMGDISTPTSERQARELSGLSSQDAAETMRRAHEETGGRVTAAAIRTARPSPEIEANEWRQQATTRGIAYVQNERHREHPIGDESEREAREAQEETEAEAFVHEHAPDLAAQVGGPFETYAEARAVWARRNREEAERLRKEKERREADEREARQTAEKEVQGSARALARLAGAQHQEWRRRHITHHAMYPQAVEPAAREWWDADHIRQIAVWLTTLADEMETAR